MRSTILNPERLRVTLLVLIALLGWFSLAFIVTNTEPGDTTNLLASHALNRLAFFASLFCAFFGTMSLVAYYLTHRIYTLRREKGDMPRSLQEGGAVAATITGLAILRTVDQLTFLSATLVVLAGIVAFTYALTRK